VLEYRVVLPREHPVQVFGEMPLLSSSGRKEFFPVLAAAIVGVYDRAFFLELRARS